MLPKNVRQIGQVEGNKRIYIEDYVMTYARKTEGMSVLLGYNENLDGDTYFYISGAVKIEQINENEPVILNNEAWSEIYEDVKRYFVECEIMGWLFSKKEVVFNIDTEIRKMQQDNFKDKNKIFFIYDQTDKEEAFYFTDTIGKLVRQTGYYIYYEKNEAMQSYMIEKAPDGKVEDVLKEDSMEKIREIIAHKETPKTEKKLMNLMYGASTLLAAVILVIGAAMLDNYDKMKNMEETLNTISNNLDDGTQDTGDSLSTMGKASKNTSQNQNKEAADKGLDSVISSQKDEENISGGNQLNTKEQVPEEIVPEKKNDVEQTDNKKDSGKVDVEKKDKEIPEDSKSKKEDKSQKTSANVTQTYIVKEGDTLASISIDVYNSYSYVEKIREINGIDNSDVIITGQILKLPSDMEE